MTHIVIQYIIMKKALFIVLIATVSLRYLNRKRKGKRLERRCLHHLPGVGPLVLKLKLQQYL